MKFCTRCLPSTWSFDRPVICTHPYSVLAINSPCSRCGAKQPVLGVRSRSMPRPASSLICTVAHTSRPHARTRAHTHTHARTHKLTHTHARTHTHTRTHAQSAEPPFLLGLLVPYRDAASTVDAEDWCIGRVDQRVKVLRRDLTGGRQHATWHAVACQVSVSFMLHAMHSVLTRHGKAVVRLPREGIV
jgi:hypothetical protein